jgi:plasmid stability protein
MNPLATLFDPRARFQRAYAEYLCARFQYLPFPGFRVPLSTGWLEPRGLAAALARASRVVITGAPGAGKTTTLVHLAVSAAQRLLKHLDAPVPLFFTARADTPLPCVYDLPRGLALGDTLSARVPRLFFATALAQRRALVLIDDADLLSAEALHTALKEYHNATLIVSAEKPLAGFVEYPLPGFRDSEIETFARKLGVTDVAAFRSALKTHKVPRPLTAHPLTLRLLIHLWTQQIPLPARRTELFDAYAQALIPESETHLLLETTALALQRGDAVSNEALARSRGFLRAVKQRTVEFVHPLWQAYFAARALYHSTTLAPLRPYLADPAWREVILFYAGLVDATDLVLNLQSLGETWLAARAAAHARSLRADLRDAIRQMLLARAREGDTHALAVLREMHDSAVIEECARELHSPDARIRQRAVQILGALQSDEAVDHLLPRLRDEDVHVRAAVIAALGHAFTDRVIEPLLTVLRGDARAGVDSQIRIAAAQALGEIATEKAVPALVVELQQGTTERRAAAAEALRRIHSPLMIESLQELTRSADSQLQQYARDLLITFKQSR